MLLGVEGCGVGLEGEEGGKGVDGWEGEGGFGKCRKGHLWCLDFHVRFFSFFFFFLG